MADIAPSTPVRELRHPGAGRRRGRGAPKGRQVNQAARERVRECLGDASRAHDHLIENLHLLQDRFGSLAKDDLAALAAEMRLSLAEIYETATFYAHFDVIESAADAPPPITIRVCDSLSCAMHGADALREEIARTAGAGIRVVRAPCMGGCDRAPAIAIGHAQIAPASAETVLDATKGADQGTGAHDLPDYQDLEAYRAAGGYQALDACRTGGMAREALFTTLEESGLRGLGGAGFPTGRKWRLVHANPGPRYAVVNADEGEPGTFKDRHFMETVPHRMLEGALIGAWAVAAEALYIYIRDEYPTARHILARECAALVAAGLVPPGFIHVRRGAGAYICGEESAMLESLEGKRGLPRHKPPFPAEHGLFGQPTLINNVETLYWVPEILSRGAAWFADQGLNGAKGLRAYSVSGRVKSPGVKIAPAGITVRALIEDHCGGMADGHEFKAYLPGGASGGILPASLADLPLDFGSFEPHGGLIGSAALIVLSDADNAALAARNLMRFFEDESCGQCTPCRAGCEKSAALMERPVWDTALLTELSQTMRDASICGLGQAAPNGLLTALAHFPGDVPGDG